MTAEAQPKQPNADASVPAAATSTGWASGALITAAAFGIVAKIAGVVLSPALRGAASQSTIEIVDTVTAALAYTLAGLLVALLCAGSFELARARRIGVGPRSIVVGLSGLVVALASPAVVSRLHPAAALSLALVTSLVALVAGLTALKSPQTRAVGTVMLFLSCAGLVRPFAWEAVAVGGERASLTVFEFGVVLACAGVVVQGLATLLSATWLATRSMWRGRVLTNVGVILAFAMTWFAARELDRAPTAFESGLRAAFGQTTGVHVPSALAAVAAFLLPASIVLGAVALVQKAQPAAVIAALSLALLSHGAFDVPLQALAVVVAAEWLMLATADDRGMWASLVRSREERSEEREGRDEAPDQRPGV